MSLKKSTCILGAIIMMSAPLSAGAQNVVPMEVMSPTTGQVTYTIPLPSDWRISSNPNSQYFITAPNGIYITHPVKNAYFYGQGMGGFGQGSGRQFAPAMSAQQYFQQVVKPNFQSQGFGFIRSYALPEQVALMEKFSAGMPNTGNRRSYQAIGSDWKTGQGQTSMVVTLMTYVEGQAGVAWDASINQMEAPNSKFEYAKKAVRYGVANSVIGRDYQRTMNGKLNAFNRENARKEAERARNEDIRHRGEMGAIAARGAASIAAAKASSDILDSNMDSWNKIQAMKDGGQSASVRGIREETILTDPNSGRRYDGAPAGRGHYWVTEGGELMTTEDPNYNPNTDNSRNNDNWTQYDPE